MTIPRVIGPIALAAMALATLPTVHAQSVPTTEKPAATKVAKPIVIVSRIIDGKQFKANGNWHRLEVEVKAPGEAVKAALLAAGANKAYADPVHWINNVKVTLVAGYAPSGNDLSKPKVYQDVLKLKDAAAAGKTAAELKDSKKVDNWRFYKASATVLTLETNVNKSIFFYIPADIVKRDEINNPRPDVAYVTLELDGQEIPFADEAGAIPNGTFPILFGPTLGKPSKATLDKVREVADRATRDTAGVMRPQNLVTGFIDGDWKNSPEFVREDASK